jgi:archaeal flagellar protein FlaJ
MVESLKEGYHRVSLRVFGPVAARVANRSPKLRHALEQAHIEQLPEDYVASTWMNTVLGVLLGYVVVMAAIAVTSTLGSPLASPVVAVLLILPFLLGASWYVAQSVFPDYKAGERRRLIDRDLPYAVNYIAAMSSAGIVPTVLLRDLAREKTYGEVSREVAWIIRDIDLLGIDLLTSINRAIARSPSQRFQEFLQGAKTSILSGGDLKVYFASKAEQYMGENRRTQKEFLDGLGILAESYVTVVIAGPLFMLVMLSIMLLLGRGTASSMTFLFALVFLALPLAHSAFAWVVKNMAPEA